ncbi:MAG: hypothetical protein ACHREM_03385 [Polyangiales bacterium]
MTSISKALLAGETLAIVYVSVATALELIGVWHQDPFAGRLVCLAIYVRLLRREPSRDGQRA